MAVVLKSIRKTQLNTIPVYFSDFYDNLNTQPVKNDLLVKVNEESVKTSIKNIILTDRGERFFNPTFGGDIRKMLFENFNPVTEQVMRDLIRNSIENFEPRANLIDVSVTGSPDLNSMIITIIFSVINKIEPVTFEIILNRVR